MATRSIVSNAGSKGLPPGYATKSGSANLSSSQKATVASQGKTSGSGGSAIAPSQSQATQNAQNAWNSMSSSQQTAFQKANPTFDSSNIVAKNYQNASGKYESLSGSGVYERAAPDAPIQPTQTSEGTTGESPGPTGDQPTADTAGGGGQEKAQETLQNNQNVVGGNVNDTNVGQTKQQALDKAVAAGTVSVDKSGNVMSKSGHNMGNINGMDLTQSTIGIKQPQANQQIQDQTVQNQQKNQTDQQKINNISPDVSLGLTNSPDSPFWNNFGQGAINNENLLPGFMNERNKIIASGLMLNNPDMKFMSDAKRKESILKDIVDRQEGGIDPAMEGWYKKTVDNINNLINRELPAMTANDYFSAILNGEKLPASSTQSNPLLKSARSRYNDLQTYSSMDVKGLTSAITSGKLNKGGQLWNDLINKGMGDLLDSAYSQYNIKTESSVLNYVMGETNKFDTSLSLEDQASPKIDLGTGLEAQISEKILSLMTDKSQLPTLASALLADEDVQTAKNASRATEAEIATLQDEISGFADEIKTKVVEKGGEATDDPFLNAYIQEKTKPFNTKLMQLQGQYRNQIAILTDASENARTEFEVNQANRQSEIQGYTFVLSRLDKQKAEAQAKAQADQQQSNWQQTFDYNKSKADTPNMQVTGYDNNGKPIYQYFDSTTNSWKSSPTQGSTTISGNMTTTTFGGKTFKTDSTVASALSNVEQQLNTAGIGWDTGAVNGPRSQEEQAKLVKEGKSWTMNSNHNKGTAVDMYENNGKSSALLPPSAKMVAIMEANGFKQSSNPSDKGHFDYVGKVTPTQGQQTPITIDDITSFNDSVERRNMKPDDVNRIGLEKQKIMNDPKADISDIMAWSQGGKAIGETQSKSLLKFDQAISQIEPIVEQINKMKTGPIIGKLRSMNPWDSDANLLKAQLQGLVPTIARGIYGEVGVLTDNDVRLYAQTLPTLKGTEETNKLVLGMTMNVLAEGYKKTMASLAGQGYDVSGLEGVYKNLKSQSDQIKQEMGISTTPESTPQPGTNRSNMPVSPYSRVYKQKTLGGYGD